MSSEGGGKHCQLSHPLSTSKGQSYFCAKGVRGYSRGWHCYWTMGESTLWWPQAQQKQVEALGKATRVEVARLWEMFPLKGERSQPSTIRICAACCLEDSYHRIAWQLYSTEGCDRHRLRLLPRCWGCEKPFSVEGLLKQQNCVHCGMPLKTMVKRQKAY
jgi:hypothetical protein